MKCYTIVNEIISESKEKNGIETNMENRLYETIRKARRERGLTQEQLAEVMGVSVGAVSKWEQGDSLR